LGKSGEGKDKKLCASEGGGRKGRDESYVKKKNDKKKGTTWFLAGGEKAKSHQTGGGGGGVLFGFVIVRERLLDLGWTQIRGEKGSLKKEGDPFCVERSGGGGEGIRLFMARGNKKGKKKSKKEGGTGRIRRLLGLQKEGGRGKNDGLPWPEKGLKRVRGVERETVVEGRGEGKEVPAFALLVRLVMLYC